MSCLNLALCVECTKCLQNGVEKIGKLYYKAQIKTETKKGPAEKFAYFCEKSLL